MGEMRKKDDEMSLPELYKELMNYKKSGEEIPQELKKELSLREFHEKLKNIREDILRRGEKETGIPDDYLGIVACMMSGREQDWEKKLNPKGLTTPELIDPNLDFPETSKQQEQPEKKHRR